MYLGTKLRKFTLGIVLFAAALGGMPMKPEEIEEVLHAHNEDRIVQVIDAEDMEEENAIDNYRFEGLASGMTEAEILRDFPDLSVEDLVAVRTFAANQE